MGKKCVFLLLHLLYFFLLLSITPWLFCAQGRYLSPSVPQISVTVHCDFTAVKTNAISPYGLKFVLINEEMWKSAKRAYQYVSWRLCNVTWMDFYTFSSQLIRRREYIFYHLLIDLQWVFFLRFYPLPQIENELDKSKWHLTLLYLFCISWLTQ